MTALEYLTDLAPGEQALWRNVKKHLWFGHTTQIMEVTEKSIVLWRERPPLNVRIPISSLTDIVITNQQRISNYYGYSPGHTYGGGWSGPRVYVGQSQSSTVGTVNMFIGSKLVMQWNGINNPNDVRNLIKAEMK